MSSESQRSQPQTHRKVELPVPAYSRAGEFVLRMSESLRSAREEAFRRSLRHEARLLELGCLPLSDRGWDQGSWDRGRRSAWNGDCGDRGRGRDQV